MHNYHYLFKTKTTFVILWGVITVDYISVSETETTLLKKAPGQAVRKVRLKAEAEAKWSCFISITFSLTAGSGGPSFNALSCSRI